MKPKDVSAELVIKRLFLDGAFLTAARTDLQATLDEAGYQLTAKDFTYVQGLLKAKLGEWPTRKVSDLMLWVGYILAVPGRIPPSKGEIAPLPPVWPIKMAKPKK